MSPRSKELMDAAREALAGARGSLGANAPARAASAAYYAMLYAARAALSEADESAKTHRGTWHRFRQRFVAGGPFPKDLFERAQAAQAVREAGDYQATPPSREQAEALAATAERFVSEIEAMLEG